MAEGDTEDNSSSSSRSSESEVHREHQNTRQRRRRQQEESEETLADALQEAGVDMNHLLSSLSTSARRVLFSANTNMRRSLLLPAAPPPLAPRPRPRSKLVRTVFHSHFLRRKEKEKEKERHGFFSKSTGSGLSVGRVEQHTLVPGQPLLLTGGSGSGAGAGAGCGASWLTYVVDGQLTCVSDPSSYSSHYYYFFFSPPPSFNQKPKKYKKK